MESINDKSPSYWDEAYEKVESYLHSLRIKNKRLLSRLVYLILEKAAKREKETPGVNPTVLAMEEAQKITSDWYKKVLNLKSNESDIPVRGRLAMLLADVPNKSLDCFLGDGPWSEEFVKTMQDSYISAGPDFQNSPLHHRALKLTQTGNVMAGTFNLVTKRPFFKFLAYWVVITLVFVFIFYITR